MAAHGRTLHLVGRRPRSPPSPLPRRRPQPTRTRPPHRRHQPAPTGQPRPRPQRPPLDHRLMTTKPRDHHDPRRRHTAHHDPDSPPTPPPGQPDRSHPSMHCATPRPTPRSPAPPICALFNSVLRCESLSRAGVYASAQGCGGGSPCSGRSPRPCWFAIGQAAGSSVTWWPMASSWAPRRRWRAVLVRRLSK